MLLLFVLYEYETWSFTLGRTWIEGILEQGDEIIWT